MALRQKQSKSMYLENAKIIAREYYEHLDQLHDTNRESQPG